MLQDLRDQKNSWLIVVLFGVIIIVFIFMFGLPGTDSCVSKKSQGDLATIGSHSVGYDMMRSMVYQRYGDDEFSADSYPMTARAVTEGIGVIYLLADAAREAGLRVSDEELQDYITNWEFGNSDVIRLGFLKNNKFNSRSYNDALQRYWMSARDYEAYKREELLARHYMTLMASSISVSDESLWQTYAFDHATASLEVIRMTPDAVRATFKPITPEEIAAFKTASKADIDTYYNEHRGDFTTPAKAKLQQIVIQKQLSKLTNPGAKTVKTYQPAERFAIARTQILEKGLDFGQAFTDYDESEDKSLSGMTGLLSIDIMAESLQKALEGQAVGAVVTAELSDRYIIAKVVEKAEEVVAPVDSVADSIAEKLIDERRIAARTQEASTNILALAGQGKSLQEALTLSLYANVLAEQPMAPAVQPEPAAEEGTAADGAEAAEQTADAAEQSADGAETAAEPAQPVLVPVPTDLPIIPEANRVSAKVVADAETNTNFIMGVGLSDDMARDIRNAAANTLLPQAYAIGSDTVIVRVTEKKDASREKFVEETENLRKNAIAIKTLQLVGDPEAVIDLTGPYGLWVQQKINLAKANGTFVVKEGYFNQAYQRVLEKKAEKESRQNGGN